MKFRRCVFRPREREITPKIRAAAAKRANKEAQDMALFPDLRRYHTADEVIAGNNTTNIQWCRQFRRGEAARWKTGRAILRTLKPAIRLALLRVWDQSGTLDSASFLEFCRNTAANPALPLWKLRVLALYRWAREARQAIPFPVIHHLNSLIYPQRISKRIHPSPAQKRHLRLKLVSAIASATADNS